MTRSVATFMSGTLPVTSSGQIDMLIGVLTASIQNFTSSGVPAFELAETVTGTSASIDLVFHSVGDRSLGSGSHIGDTDIWFRFIRTAATTLQFGAMQDWSPTSSNITNTVSTNPGAARPSNANATTNTTWTLLTDTAAIDYWSVGNEYEHVFVCNQAGTFRFLHWGNPKRLAREGVDGVARILTTLTGSGAVTIQLDRNISGTTAQNNVVKVGQRIHIIPQTPDNVTLEDANIDIVTVNSVVSGTGGSPDQINVSTTSKMYPSGSLVGYQPANVFITAGTTNFDANVYMTNRPDGGFTGAALQVAAHETATPVAEADVDPDASNFYIGTGIYVYSDQASHTGPRGTCGDVVALFPIGTQVNGDRMIVGNKFYFVFPSITFSTFCLGIGTCLLP